MKLIIYPREYNLIYGESSNVLINCDISEEKDSLVMRIKDQQEEIEILRDKCSMLSEVVLEFADLATSCRSAYDVYDSAYNARELMTKHKDLIQELKRNLEVKSEKNS